MSTATGAPTAAPSQPVLTDEERDTVELPLWSIALGLVLGLLGSIAINTGNNLQSMGLQELQKKEELDELDNGGSDQDEKPESGGWQLNLFASDPRWLKLKQRLSTVEPDALSPREAHNLLYELKAYMKGEA